MNEKILPDDIESKSLRELTDIADRLIQELESKKNLEESIDDYQYLIKLNNLIEKKFQKDSKKWERVYVEGTWYGANQILKKQ